MCHFIYWADDSLFLYTYFGWYSYTSLISTVANWCKPAKTMTMHTDFVVYTFKYTVFACILHYFYLVDDIYDTKPTFIYQYFIIYSVLYERLICACIPNISPNTRYLIWKTHIRYDPVIWYLEPYSQDQHLWTTRSSFKLCI